MKAYIFPGQGAQFVGMGKELYENSTEAKALFEQANQLLGFEITAVMFEGTDEQLKATQVTQPAIFLHSVILALTSQDFNPQAVAGHSLGEFSALVANKTLSFEDGLRLVATRAQAMQKACDAQPSTMAAVLGMDDAQVEQICASIKEEVVVPANYNSFGQLVISGSEAGIDLAIEMLKAAGAKRVVKLNVGGAFHSPLMESARQELAQAIEKANFSPPIAPIYQNATASPATDISIIKENLVKQLTAPVRWTQTVQNMQKDGFTTFVEVGPGNVLRGLVKKIYKEAQLDAL